MLDGTISRPSIGNEHLEIKIVASLCENSRYQRVDVLDLVQRWYDHRDASRGSLRTGIFPAFVPLATPVKRHSSNAYAEAF